MPQIIVVSLIDILAILLIFFIVTTTFRKQMPQVNIRLPHSETATPSAATARESIILALRGPHQVTLDGKPVRMEALANALQNARAENPNRPFAMQVDRDAPFSLVVHALDALTKAGLRNVPTFTQPKKEK
ncbi:MAG: biopolymer transporter ExbD [Verrucomicrobia bacterium]|nr:MAG: biopolymer transporter ExbD [Verrucomicrobiota bacterium]